MKRFFLMSIVLGLFLTTVISGCGGDKKTAIETVIFADDFEDLEVGFFWSPTTNPVNNRKNWCSILQPSTYAVINEGGTEGKVIWYESGSNYLLNGDAGLTNYSISAKVRLTSNATQGIIGRYNDATHYYTLMLGDGALNNPSERQISLWKTNSRVASESVTVNPSTYYVLKLVFSNTNIKGYFNGIKLIDYNDTTDPISNGRFGIKPTNADMYFADFKVTQP